MSELIPQSAGDVKSLNAVTAGPSYEFIGLPPN